MNLDYLYCKCILQTLEQLLTVFFFFSVTVILRKGRKCNHIKCLVKTTNTREGKEDNRNKEQNSKQKTVTNMVDINPTMSIINLNHNGLNMSIKE